MKKRGFHTPSRLFRNLSRSILQTGQFEKWPENLVAQISSYNSEASRQHKVEKSGEKWRKVVSRSLARLSTSISHAGKFEKWPENLIARISGYNSEASRQHKVDKSGEKWRKVVSRSLARLPHPFRTLENSRNGRKISLPEYPATIPKPSASPKHKAEAQHPTVGGGKQQKTEWYENRRQRPATQPPPQDGNPKSHPYHPGAQNSHAGIFFETGFEAWKFQNSSGKYKQLKLLGVFVCFLAARNFC